jgi:hypothetical protein
MNAVSDTFSISGFHMAAFNQHKRCSSSGGGIAAVRLLRQNMWASRGPDRRRSRVSRALPHRPGDQAWQTIDHSLAAAALNAEADAEVRAARVDVGCGGGSPTAACRLPQAAFNGFLGIKSMRLFALRTVSIGKPAGAADVSMRWRWPAAAAQAGRRSCGRAGPSPDESARRSLAAWRTSAGPSAVVAGRKDDGWL